MEQPTSNIFEGLKKVGHVTGALPFIIRHGKRPQDTRIITIVGKTFQTYTTNLSLIEVSIPHEHNISKIISDDRLIYSAAGRTIFSWARGSKKLVHKLDNGHQADVKLMAKFGPDRLLAVDDDNNLFNWNLKEKEILNIINLEETEFKISHLIYPMNYGDKVLLASKQGSMQLWDIPKEQCLYKYSGWDETEITCLVQSPIEDVVGIGLADGHIYVLNIKYDETVMKIYQEYGRVTSMSFRLDGQPYMVSASENGHLMIWNLSRKRLSSQIRNAHSDISNCQFIRNETLLVTAGSDNRLKIWSMDMSDGGGNLLCQRAGHDKPPTFIRFYGQKGINLLSAGDDSTMKMFHMFSERLNKNLGTARHDRKLKNNKLAKLSPIVNFSAETAKEKQWDNIAACHKDSSMVTTWNYDKSRMGDHRIWQPTFDKHDVVASRVCVTSCGNFVVIGYSNGFIFKYNIQSGIFRSTYEDTKLEENRAHDGSINGLTVDILSIILISGGIDSKLKLWNFKTAALLMEIECQAPIMNLDVHKENNLAAIAMTNNTIAIMDLETRNLIREFEADAKILDMTFSPDSRWLIVSYDDNSIRTWDLNLGKLIDGFCLSSPCISLSMSATGEFLATAHQDSLGINIWCNYTIYSPTTIRPIDSKEFRMLEMPFVKCDEMLDDLESEDPTLPVIDPQIESQYTSPNQIDESLITLSGLPSSRWKNILDIEELRRKQLIQDEEKPIKVPFFIPVKDGLRPQLDKEAIVEINQENKPSQIKDMVLLTPIAQDLIKAKQSNDYGNFINQMKDLGPSAIDAEIKLLSKETCGENVASLCFLSAIEQALGSNMDFELVSSWLASFLRAHSDTIQKDPEINLKCADLKKSMQHNWDRVNGEFNQIFAVLNFVRSSIL